MNTPGQGIIAGEQVARVVRISNNQVKVECPLCNKFHFHGIGDGHRVRHCLKENIKPEFRHVSGYVIKGSDGSMLKS